MKRFVALLLLLPAIALAQVTTNPGVTGVVGTGITGLGNVVLQTSPILVTPTIGAATGTSLEITGGTQAAGTITKAAANGLVISGAPGSSYDFMLTNPTGSSILLFLQEHEILLLRLI